MKPETAAARRSDSTGTALVAVGTAVLVAGGIAFQVLAGRKLGTEQFAPIGIIWTVQFIVTSVLLLPVQNLITRQLALASGGVEHLRPERSKVIAVFFIAIGAGTAFALATVNRFFLGEMLYPVLLAVTLTGRGVVSISRGFLAGRRRFIHFGESLAAEGLALIVFGVAVFLLAPSTIAFAACVALAPFAVLMVRPFSRTSSGAVVGQSAVVDYEHPKGFLEYLITATGASQFILAGGPIVVGFVGGDPVAVSVIFVTFTLFRGPVTSAYNFVARVLPDFTAMARDGRVAETSRWLRRITWGGFGLTVVGFLGGFAVGPWLVELLYGSAFAPARLIAGLAGAGVGAALGGLFTGQIYIAQGRTRALAIRWGGALLAACIVVLLPIGSADLRVAAAFAVGEVVALVLLGFAWVRGWPGEADIARIRA
jgi:O-antigen/teichoic acid export membrane protein